MIKKQISVGSSILNILKANNLKSTHVIKATNIPKSTFSKILSSKTPITIATDALITKALGLSQGYFLDIQKMVEIYELKNNKEFKTKIKNVTPIIHKSLNIHI